MSTTQITYSEPTITRTATESTLVFDVTIGGWIGWESIRIEASDDGGVEISDRGDGPVRIPAQFLPLVLAEIDRIVAADGDLPLAPFAPLAAVQHVAGEQAA